MNERVYCKNQLKHQLFAGGKGWLAAAVFSMAILSAYNIVISWLLQKIIDIAAGDDIASLYFVIKIAVVTFMIFMASYFIYRTARPRFIQAAMTQYKASVFEKVLEKKIGSLSNEGTSRLISALTNDMRLIEDHYLDTILEFTDIGISFVGALLLMLWYSPLLTLCSILFSILPIVVSVAPSRKLAQAEKNLSDGNAAYVEIIKDILSGFSVIKSFQAEKQIQKKFEIDNNKIESMKFARRYAEENVNLLSTATSVIMRLGIFIAGAWMAVCGMGVTPGTVLVFLQLVTFVITPIERVPARLANRRAAQAIMEKLSDFLSEPNEVSGKEISPTLTSGISVCDLSFGYEKGKEILKHIDLNFEAGKNMRSWAAPVPEKPLF